MPYPGFLTDLRYVDAVRRGRTEPRPARCWYCPALATITCTEKITGPWITFPGDLQPFALIQDTAALDWCMVESVERKLTATPGCPWLNDEIVLVRIKRRTGGGCWQVVERAMRPLLPVLELRSEPCERQTCELHARDLGDGEHFRCLQHWYDDAPQPAGELELNRQWQGLLETAVQIRREKKK
jgi:hypothetical protein